MNTTISHLMAASSIRAGGPGSGRHKELDAMDEMARAHGYRLSGFRTDGLTYKHPKGHSLTVRQHADGSVQWHHRSPGSTKFERGKDAGSLSDHLGWVHSGQKEVNAGGPGSGRHPEFGNFRHMSTSSFGGTNYHRFQSPGGDKIVYHQVFNPSSGKVFENNKPVHSGDVDSAERFMDEKYGIKN